MGLGLITLPRGTGARRSTVTPRPATSPNAFEFLILDLSEESELLDLTWIRNRRNPNIPVAETLEPAPASHMGRRGYEMARAVRYGPGTPARAGNYLNIEYQSSAKLAGTETNADLKRIPNQHVPLDAGFGRGGASPVTPTWRTSRRSSTLRPPTADATRRSTSTTTARSTVSSRQLAQVGLVAERVVTPSRLLLPGGLDQAAPGRRRRDGGLNFDERTGHWRRVRKLLTEPKPTSYRRRVRSRRRS